MTKEGLDTVDGKPVITLKASEDSGTIYVSPQGEPYPVRIEGVQSTDAGEARVVLNFSEFGTVLTAIEPPTGEIVDISSG